MTPAVWLTRQRVLHARRLLERMDLGVERIAEESGFGTSCCRAPAEFTSVRGMSPVRS